MSADLPTVPDEVFEAALRALYFAPDDKPSLPLLLDMHGPAEGLRAALAVAFAAGQAAAYEGGPEEWQVRYAHKSTTYPLPYGAAYDREDAMLTAADAVHDGHVGVTVRMRHRSAWVDVPVVVAAAAVTP